MSIKLAHPFPAPELRTRILRTRGFFFQEAYEIIFLRFCLRSFYLGKCYGEVPETSYFLQWLKPWSSFPWCFGKYQGKPPKKPRNFCPLWTPENPRKTEKNSWKHSKHQGISSVRKDQGKSKHQGKEDQGKDPARKNKRFSSVLLPPYRIYHSFQNHYSADCKGAGGKRPRQKASKIVKKCQKVFRHFLTIFAQGKKRQKASKVSKSFSTLFARHLFSGRFCNPLNYTHEITIFELFRGLQLQLSGVFRIN